LYHLRNIANEDLSLFKSYWCAARTRCLETTNHLVLLVVLVLLKLLVVVLLVVSGFDSGATEDGTMKAPGQDVRISREGFEKNPAGYFRDLQKK
jgi:hypothetical protein